MTFLSPTKFLDFYEHNSDVPVAPCPRVEESRIDMDWDEDYDEVDAAMADDDEFYAWEANLMKFEEQEEVVIDDERFYKDMIAKVLKEACQKHQLATSGSKKKLLKRLGAYKLRMQMLMESEIARKMYEEKRRKPPQIKPPRLPS